MSNILLRDDERIDDLQYKGLKLIQNEALFCFGTDAVLLASFVEIRKGERVVDFGTGTGIIPILLSGREQAKEIKGIEIQKEAAALAKRNVALNHLEDTVRIITGDIKEAARLLTGAYDVVVANPPYDKQNGRQAPDGETLNIARRENLLHAGGYDRKRGKGVEKRRQILHDPPDQAAGGGDRAADEIPPGTQKTAVYSKRRAQSAQLHADRSKKERLRVSGGNGAVDHVRRERGVYGGTEKNLSQGVNHEKRDALFWLRRPSGTWKTSTVRAKRILTEADAVAAEDTRHTIHLLNHFDIKNKLISFHEYSGKNKYEKILDMLKKGKTVALVSDAGTPLISDPGEELVRQAVERGADVVPVPGACAPVLALIVSGLPVRRFCFEGFLPSKKEQRRKRDRGA